MRKVSSIVDYLISFLCIVISLTSPMFGRSSTMYIASYFSSLEFFEVEKFTFLTGNGCIIVGHYEAHATSLQKEIK